MLTQFTDAQMSHLATMDFDKQYKDNSIVMILEQKW